MLVKQRALKVWNLFLKGYPCCAALCGLLVLFSAGSASLPRAIAESDPPTQLPRILLRPAESRVGKQRRTPISVALLSERSESGKIAEQGPDVDAREYAALRPCGQGDLWPNPQ